MTLTTGGSAVDTWTMLVTFGECAICGVETLMFLGWRQSDTKHAARKNVAENAQKMTTSSPVLWKTATILELDFPLRANGVRVPARKTIASASDAHMPHLRWLGTICESPMLPRLSGSGGTLTTMAARGETSGLTPKDPGSKSALDETMHVIRLNWASERTFTIAGSLRTRPRGDTVHSDGTIRGFGNACVRAAVPAMGDCGRSGGLRSAMSEPSWIE